MTVKLLTEPHLVFLSLKEASLARLSLHLSKYYIVGNQMSQLIYNPHIESNLVNLKSSGLEILFENFRSLNYREVDIKVFNHQNDYFQFFLCSHMICVRKRNISVRCFFYKPKS